MEDVELVPPTQGGDSAEGGVLTTFPARFSISTQRFLRLVRGSFWRRRVAVLVGLDQVDVTSSLAEAARLARHDVSAIGGLLDGTRHVVLTSAKGLAPNFIAVSVGFYKVHVAIPRAEASGRARGDIAPIRGLLDRIRAVVITAAEGLGPDFIAVCAGKR